MNILTCYVPHLLAQNDFATLQDVSLTFKPGSGSLLGCTNVAIVNDTTLEDHEQFLVFLTTLDPDVTIRPTIATVTIVDDDGKGAVGLTSYNMATDVLVD